MTQKNTIFYSVVRYPLFKSYVMKKQILIGFLILITLGLNSQDLKKIIKRNCNRNVSEVYQVRRSDDSTKEGLYQQFFCFISNNIKDYVFDADAQQELVSEMGYYKNGQRDSFWIKKAMPGVIDEQGFYKDGKKMGIWKKVKRVQAGYVHEFYDYTNKTLLEPEVIIKLAYPSYASVNEMDEEVVLSFNVKRDCTIENLKVIKSKGGCDEEAKRKISHLYELNKKYRCMCEEKSTIEKVVFNLE
jgi:hypothetical protein